MEVRVEQHAIRIGSLEQTRDRYVPIVESLADAAMIEDAIKRSNARAVKIIVGLVGLINVIVTTVLALLVLAR